jgi:hypothetical protein
VEAKLEAQPMIRTPAIVIGSFLAALSVAGLALHANGWLAGLDGACALGAFLVAWLSSRVAAAHGACSCVYLALSMGLLVAWVLGMGCRAEGWLSWSTFAVAAVLALMAFGDHPSESPRPG